MAGGNARQETGSDADVAPGVAAVLGVGVATDDGAEGAGAELDEPHPAMRSANEDVISRGARMMSARHYQSGEGADTRPYLRPCCSASFARNSFSASSRYARYPARSRNGATGSFDFPLSTNFR